MISLANLKSKLCSKESICILLLIVVAGFFRFSALGERGLFEWDEGYYIQLASTYRAGFDFLAKKYVADEPLPSMNEYLLEHGGTPKSVFKDGYTYLLLLASFIFGMNYNTGLFLNALLGSITVIALFIFIRRYSGSLAGFLVALGLAVSPYHIAYSRSGYSTIAAALFLLCCIAVYLTSIDSRRYGLLYLSGLLLGMSFSCHYVVAVFVLSFFVLELWRTISWKELKHSTVFFIGFASWLIFIEIISRVIKFFIDRFASGTAESGEFVTYFQRSWRQIWEAKGGTAIRADPTYYMQSLLNHEGLAIFIFLLVFALIVYRLKKKRQAADFAVLFIFALPFLIISLALSKADRLLPLFIPLIYFIIGYGIALAYRYKKVIYSLLVVAFLSNGYRAADFFNYRSNFDMAIRYMKDNQGIKHISDDMFISRAYVGRENAIDDFFSLYAENGEVSVEKLEAFYEDGYNYLLVYNTPYHQNTLTQTALSQEPDFSVPTIGNNRGVFCGDFCLLRDRSLKPSRSINVYSLEKIIEGIKYGSTKKRNSE